MPATICPSHAATYRVLKRVTVSGPAVRPKVYAIAEWCPFDSSEAAATLKLREAYLLTHPDDPADSARAVGHIKRRAREAYAELAATAATTTAPYGA